MEDCDEYGVEWNSVGCKAELNFLLIIVHERRGTGYKKRISIKKQDQMVKEKGHW